MCPQLAPSQMTWGNLSCLPVSIGEALSYPLTCRVLFLSLCFLEWLPFKIDPPTKHLPFSLMATESLSEVDAEQVDVRAEVQFFGWAQFTDSPTTLFRNPRRGFERLLRCGQERAASAPGNCGQGLRYRFHTLQWVTWSPTPRIN